MDSEKSAIKRGDSDKNSDASSDESNIAGCHEDWESAWNSGSQLSESTPTSSKLTVEWDLENARRELEQANLHIKHMEWHCTVSRRALFGLPGGQAALEATRNELYDAGEFCRECELEQLQAKVKQLEMGLQAYRDSYSENKRKRKSM